MDTISELQNRLSILKSSLEERVGSEITNDITTWLTSKFNRFDVMDVSTDINEGLVDFTLDGQQWTIGGFATGPNSIRFYVESIDTGERWTADREVSKSRTPEGIEDAVENSPIRV